MSDQFSFSAIHFEANAGAKIEMAKKILELNTRSMLTLRPLQTFLYFIAITSLLSSEWNTAIAAENPKSQLWPSLEQIQNLLLDLSEKHPEKIRLSEAGKSIDGHPIPLVVITDPSVSNENKEHILFTTLFCVSWSNTR